MMCPSHAGGGARVLSQIWNLRRLAARLDCSSGSRPGAGHWDANANETRCCLEELTAWRAGPHIHMGISE